MRNTRRKIALMALALLTGLLVMALPGVAGAKKAPEADRTNGKGVDSVGNKFEFNAKDVDSDPSTDAANGEFTYKSDEGFFKAKVTCLRVEGDGAFFQAEIKKASDPELVGTVQFVRINDGGRPNGRGDQFVAGAAEGPDCQEPGAPVPDIEKGKITVVDVAEN